MNAKQWSTRLTWITDTIAMIALASTDEIQPEFWAIILATLLSSWLVKAKLPVKWAFGVLATIVIGAIAAGMHYHYHPVVMAAYGAPLIHAITWLTPNDRRTRGWRMGFGFGELILASALTTEAYLIILIFAFIIIAAVSSSCLFLEGELEMNAKAISLNPLPKGYISRSMGLACLIFLISLLIFPILPRMKMVSHGWDSLQTGYTEKVNLTEGAKFGGNSESGTPLVWLISREKKDLSLEIPYGLIRGRSLDVFDGANWSIGFTPIPHEPVPFMRKKTGPILVVDAMRAPSNSDALPVPYGTFRVFSGVLENQSFPRHFEGDWTDHRTMRENARYTFAFEPQTLVLEGQTLEDSPRPIQLRVPQALNTKRMKNLVNSLFKPGLTEREKVSRISTFFTNQHFLPTLNSKPVDEMNRNPNVRMMHPLERFLFLAKEGNCEWFATSSAILLRMAGVPTRLVAGFRLTHGPVGDVLTIKSSDAHAWIEYWSRTTGWTPYDPTPKVVSSPNLFKIFSDAYELMSNYWYRFILGYNSKEAEKGTEEAAAQPHLNHEGGVFKDLKEWRNWVLGKLGKQGVKLFFIITSLLLMGGAVYLFLRYQYPWLFSIRYRVRLGSRDLWAERLKMEKLVKSHARVKAQTSLSKKEDKYLDVSDLNTYLEHPLLSEWIAIYLRLRFGRETPERAQLLSSMQESRRSLAALLCGT